MLWVALGSMRLVAHAAVSAVFGAGAGSDWVFRRDAAGGYSIRVAADATVVSGLAIIDAFHGGFYASDLLIGPL